MPNAAEYMLAPVLADSAEPLSKVVSLLRAQKEGAHVVVTERGKYLGVIDDRSLRDFQGDVSATKAAKAARAVRKLARNSPAEEIVEAFLNTEAKVLPVLDGDKPVGVVHRAAALSILLDSPAISKRRVEELMTTPPVTVGEETTIAEAERAMRANGINRLVVVDKSGRLAGVFSTYDLATKVKSGVKSARRDATFRPGEDLNVQNEPVRSVMTSVVATTPEGASVKEAVQQMLERGLSNLVVTKGDKPVGVFTSRDALEVVATIPMQNIIVFGLREDERPLRQSLVDEAQAFIERVKKSARVDYVTMQVRSVNEGMKRRYQVRVRVSINGHLHTAGTPDLDPHTKIWDAGMATREALGNAEKIFYKHEKRGKRGKGEGKFEYHRFMEGG